MRRLWIAFLVVIVASFLVLGWVGSRIYQEAPPIPDRVLSEDGRVLFDRGEVSSGQDVWRSFGGMELGSIWGHGAYVAPDWTADWLHRELIGLLSVWSRREKNVEYEQLGAEPQAALRERLRAEVRANRFDPSTRTLTVSNDRARAIEANVTYYTQLFRDGRDSYALPKGSVKEPARARKLSAFFFWSAWAAATHRPGDDVTYTSNWPHEPLIGNAPTSDALIWTGVSILLLLGGIGGLAFWHAARRNEEPPAEIPEEDPLLGSAPSPSQLATVKYFWVVCLLIVLQIVMGVITAHYGVEGTEFYGIPLAEILPYSVARTRG